MVRFKTRSKDRNISYKWKCPGKYQTFLRGICLIGVDLLPNVTQSMALFANKLDIKDQPVALECLHDWIWGRVLKEYLNPDTSYIDISYYRDLDFVQKHVVSMPYEYNWADRLDYWHDIIWFFWIKWPVCCRRHLVDIFEVIMWSIITWTNVIAIVQAVKGSTISVTSTFCITYRVIQYIPRNMHTVLLCFALLWLCNRS